LNERHNQDSIDQQLLQLIRQEHPESVQELIELAKTHLSINDKDARKRVLQLIDQEKITLKATSKPNQRTLSGYTFSSDADWFWITILLTFATVIAVFTIPENAYPLVYIRYVLGVTFVLWLPGYTFIKALFPTQVPIKTSSENLDTIERIALSAGMSIALVPIVGLLLNYTPWGIRLTPLTLSLLGLTITFALAAITREYQARVKTKTPQNLPLEHDSTTLK